MLLLAVIVAALTAILAACGGGTSSDDNTITVKKGDKLKIGLSTTLTTDNAQLGLAIQNGAKLAVKEKGEIKGFTGVDDPYEDPASPELVVDTEAQDAEESAALIVARLEELGLVPAQVTV